MHRRLSSIIAVVALTTGAVVNADAQIFQPRRSGEPSVWIGASVGYFVPGTVVDGRSNSTWNFGSDIQYRLSLEVPVGRGATVGAFGSWSRMPLDYTVRGGGFPIQNAHADLWSAGGQLHIGGGRGFHQIIDVGLGAMGYRNFREDGTDTELAPDADTDFFVSLGYGFGFPIGQRTVVTLVQDAGYSFHQRDGLSGSARTATRFFNLRAGMRAGF
ncbi:MAG TPA: hypothetical protein VJ672_07370 [Gemmatimonadaceae bacterium]|nr:hypothetical protein [Gemmatimonadaceae bacterium]